MMPGSSDKGKTVIQTWFAAIQDKKLILDVGPGWGTYSKLLREPGQTWHAVEIHQPYVAMFQLQQHYDKIYIEDVRAFIPDTHYDVAICGDVLEHMSNEEAVLVLQKLLNYANWVIVSLPLDAETNAPPDTGADYWQNPYEFHVGRWSHDLFLEAVAELGGRVLACERYPEIAVYLIVKP